MTILPPDHLGNLEPAAGGLTALLAHAGVAWVEVDGEGFRVAGQLAGPLAIPEGLTFRDVLHQAIHPEDLVPLLETLDLEGQHERVVRTDPALGPVRHYRLCMEIAPDWLSVVQMDLTEQHRAERALRGLLQGSAGLSGNEYLHTMLKHLCRVFDAQVGLVGEWSSDDPDTVRTRALVAGGEVEPAITYALHGTPCAHVVGERACIFPSGVADLFPEDDMLREMGAQGYLGTPIYASDGRPLGLVVLISTQPLVTTADGLDILEIFSARAGVEVERMLAEEALSRLQQVLVRTERMNAMASLGAGLAHDLNNLLSVVANYAQLAEEEVLAGDRPDPQGLRRLREAAQKAGELTAQLMAFGRGKRIREDHFDVGQRLQGLGSLLRAALPRTVTLEVEVADEPMAMTVDPVQVEQVVVNLVLNARDAMEGCAGTIRVEARPEGCGQVLLAVSDTGKGMPPELQARIFEPFFTTKPQGRGSGLGLAGVRAIVEELGGTLALQSEPGQGTRFEIRLPMA